MMQSEQQMKVTATKTDANTLTIKVQGTLGNSIHKEFRAAYESNDASKFIVDLSATENIDSSGLGMLLLFRDFAGGDDSNIQIINCTDHILDIFHVTCFFITV